MRLGPRLLVAVALAALAGAAVPAAAEEVTRDSYRDEVEPICKVNTEANERIFAGARAEVREGKYRAAARRFDRASRALKQTLARLRVVPRPPADESRLERWFREIKKEVVLFEATAAKLRAGNKFAAQRLVVRLIHQATAANSVVIPFQFRYCQLEPARFT
jgi:hypothetical protein